MYIKQTHSTSTLLREQYSDELPHLYTIRTDFQTAGRGQAGNAWESEESKNLLFSALLRYEGILAAEQWRLSMLVAVALWDTLANYLSPEQLTIKWPNDIYFGDKKLVGILIENCLAGKYVGYTIAGIGVNVNQTRWLSNAPNPISMMEITGKQYDVERLMNEWISSMKSWELRTTEEIKATYMQHLYRRNGWHEYVEREVSIAPTAIAQKGIEDAFLAQIVNITELGELLLRLQNNEKKKYHFKQIRFVIQN
jgi:BirA family biotin operon repressor/biotin-[acetyl-CoA-carboxylase] ligase